MHYFAVSSTHRNYLVTEGVLPVFYQVVGADKDLGEVVGFSTIVESTASLIPLFTLQALVEKRLHESEHVRLDLVVRASLKELRDPARPESVVLEEILAQHL